MAKKIFREIFQPEEFEFVNLKGETFILQTLFLSAEKNIEIEKKVKKIDTGEITATEMILEIMVSKFGKDKEFWQQFSLDMLNEVANYFKDDLKKKSQIK